jgi:Lrp/AsnC family transcriptional regulator, leucine-responsive regulatory protein
MRDRDCVTSHRFRVDTSVDARDRRILTALQSDGRLRDHDLSREVGLSPGGLRQRARRLERDGLVRGCRADVAPEALGIGLQAFVAAALITQGLECVEAFECAVRGLRAVRTCYRVTGRFDFILRIAGRDAEHLGRLIAVDLAALPGLARLETLMVAGELKRDRGWPVPQEAD